jgi:hypothetical protein
MSLPAENSKEQTPEEREQAICTLMDSLSIVREDAERINDEQVKGNKQEKN